MYEGLRLKSDKNIVGISSRKQPAEQSAESDAVEYAEPDKTFLII